MTHKTNWDAVITAGLDYIDALNRYWIARVNAGYSRDDNVWIDEHNGDALEAAYHALTHTEHTLYAMSDLLGTNYAGIITAARCYNKYYANPHCNGCYLDAERLLDCMAY